MTHVVVAGGGTGGHLFPGLAVAAELQRAGAHVSWLGAARGVEATRVPAVGIPLYTLAVTGAVGRSRAAQWGAALRVIPAILRAQAYLLRERVGAVLAVGGYAAVPGAFAAAGIGLPVVVQEQNALPGVTNRIIAPWASAIACGFAQGAAAFPSLPAVWTGNPVRPEFFNVPPAPARDGAILVLGGSQGSAFLNRALPDAFALVARAGSLPRIVHQAGPAWARDVEVRYRAVGLGVEVVGFIERPADALAAASLVIARAGALTISELAAARRPALLVPFAAAAHNHQLFNARAYAETGAAEILEEGRASAVLVAETVQRLLAWPDGLAARGQAGAALARSDAAAAVARLVLERTRGGGR